MDPIASQAINQVQDIMPTTVNPLDIAPSPYSVPERLDRIELTLNLNN